MEDSTEIEDAIKDILYAPGNDPVTQSQLHELITRSLGRNMDEEVTTKRLYQMRKDNLITMQMQASSVIHVAPTKTLEYEVRDKRIQKMNAVGFN